jgi:hypothetical protein
MLDPAAPRALCEAPGESLSVATSAGGKTRQAYGVPGCDWPGGARLGVYDAAAKRDAKALALWERRLHCDEDASLLADGAPWENVIVCELDQIRIAERIPEIAFLEPAEIFPRDIGSRRCTFPQGGIVASTTSGTCGISLVNGSSAHPVLVFVESWGARGENASHTWRIRITGANSAELVSESGPAVPQTWG